MVLNLGDKEEKIALQRERISNCWAFIFIPILTIIFGFEIGYGYHLHYVGEIKKYNDLVLIFNIITLVFVTIMYFLILICYKEKEIEALNYGFVVFYGFFAFIVPIARIVAVEYPYPPQPDGTAGQKFLHGLYVLVQCAANQCTLVACLVLRQRVFYEIFHNFNLNPSFWHGVPLFIFICILIAVPFVSCMYTFQCTLIVAYSVFYASMGIMALLFAYYLFHTYQGSRVFIHFWANMRAFVLHNLVEIILFSLVLADAGNVPVLEQLISPYFVYLIFLDTIFLPLCKAFARKFFDIELYAKLDLYGPTYRAKDDIELFDMHIKQENLYRNFQGYADELYCGENLRFLHDFHKLQTMEVTKSRAELMKEIDIFVATYFKEGATYEVNVGFESRRKVLQVYEQGNWAYIFEIFERALLEVRSNTLLGLWVSFKESDRFVDGSIGVWDKSRKFFSIRKSQGSHKSTPSSKSTRSNKSTPSKLPAEYIVTSLDGFTNV